MPSAVTRVRTLKSLRNRKYSELRRLDSFEDRFEYLKLRGKVGESTFGFERFLNQGFYTSSEWRNVRNHVIVRDEGLDLGFPDHEINGKMLVHHMNPMTPEDIENGNPDILNPDYLITVSHLTHNAIHYGDKDLLPKPYVERRPGDTKLW